MGTVQGRAIIPSLLPVHRGQQHHRRRLHRKAHWRVVLRQLEPRLGAVALLVRLRPIIGLRLRPPLQEFTRLIPVGPATIRKFTLIRWHATLHIITLQPIESDFTQQNRLR
jgi:hypothetical protein